jgi:hypothetical protein
MKYKLFKSAKKPSVFFITIFCVVAITNIQAQDTMRQTKPLKHAIKLNLTAGLIYNNAWQLSFEGLTTKNQSISVFGGYNEFPSGWQLNLQNAHLSNQTQKSGYTFGIDYRFYFKRENKFEAPHGLYIGPYVSFYQFHSTRTLTYDSAGQISTAGLRTRINFFNVGGQLGYQFALGRRWLLDAIMFGPAITHYKFRVNVEGDIPNLSNNELAQKVIDALKDRLPFMNRVAEGEVNDSGNRAFWSLGFSYSLSVGFRF